MKQTVTGPVRRCLSTAIVAMVVVAVLVPAPSFGAIPFTSAHVPRRALGHGPAALPGAPISVSSTAVRAASVTYSFSFISPVAMLGSTAMTLSMPSGTVLPTSVTSYQLWDDSEGGPFVGSSDGQVINLVVAHAADSATFGPDISVAAGDHLSLVVHGVTNPPTPGLKTMTLSLSSSSATFTAHYSLTSATSVTSAAVTQTSAAPGGAGQAYAVSFVTTNALGDGSTMSLQAPPGTVLPKSPNDYLVFDQTTGVENVDTSSAAFGAVSTVSVSGTTATFPPAVLLTSSAIAAGDRLAVLVEGVSNTRPGTARLWTSSDPLPISVPVQSGNSAASSLTLSSHAAGATNVTYSVSFTATKSFTGSSYKLVISGAPGTNFQTTLEPQEQVVDDDSGWTRIWGLFNGTSSTYSPGSGSATLSGTGQQPTITAGDRVTVMATGVTNASSTGPAVLRISTPWLNAPITLAYSLRPPAAPQAASLTLTSRSAGATEVTYAASFTATQALLAHSTITLAAAPGTVFANNCSVSNITITNDTTGQSEDICPTATSPGGPTVTVSVGRGVAVATGDRVTVLVDGVTNTSDLGDHTLSFSTSANPVPTRLAYRLTPPRAVGSASIKLSNTLLGASGVTYTAAFQAINSLAAAFSGVVLSANPPLVFPAQSGDYTISDASTGQSTLTTRVALVNGGHGAVVTLGTYMSIRTGDFLTVSVTGVTNFDAVGQYHFDVSTTADPRPVGLTYRLTHAQPLQNPTLSLGSPLVGASGVIYSIGFVASSSGALAANDSDIDITGPSGTRFPTEPSDYFVADTDSAAQAAASSVQVGPSGSSVTIKVPVSLSGGDAVAVAIDDVTNASSDGAHALTIKTSADLAGNVAFALGAGATVSGSVTFHGSPVAGAALQACPSSGACVIGTSSSVGTYSLPVLNGAYSVTAFPPFYDKTAAAATASTRVVGARPVTGVDLVLGNAPPMPQGMTMVQDGQTFAAGQLPALSWDPFSLMVNTCPGELTGFAFVTVTNTITGLPDTVHEALTEAPPGSGVYVAQFPSLRPLHGVLTIGAWVPCLPTTAVIPNMGPPAGGTQVEIYGQNLSQVTAVKFGNVPAESFVVIDDNLVSAVAPPGSGSVAVTVSGSGGSSTPTAESEYTYTEVTGVAPLGPGMVKITGSGFVPANIVAVGFGNTGSLSFTVQSDSEIDTAVPKGSGTVAVSVLGWGTSGAAAGDSYTFSGSSASAGDALDSTRRRELALGEVGTKPDEAAAASGGHERYPAFHFPGGPPFILPPGAANFGPNNINTSPAAVVVASALNCLTALSVGKRLPFCGGGGVDPSGTVVDQDGQPISLATVTILRAGAKTGPFMPIPNGSALTDPGTNPETTGTNGVFHWDVLAGWYEVQASAKGCFAPGKPADADVTSPPLSVPPPQFGIVLTMECPASLPADPSVIGVSPDRVAASGGATVTISGTNLTQTTAVEVGGHRVATFKVESPTSVLARLRRGSGTMAVVVVTREGKSRASKSAAVTYLGAPVVSKSTIASRHTRQGAVVVLVGSGLSGTTGVTINGKATPFAVASGTDLVVTTRVSGTVRVQVTSACPGGIAPPAATSCGASAVRRLRI